MGVSSRMSSSIFRTVCLVTFLTLGARPLSAALIRGQVELTAVNGEVAVKNEDQTLKTLLAGDAVREEDLLVTPAEGTAELVFSNGVRLLIGPASTIRLSTFRQVKMPAPGRQRELGELPGEGSFLEMDLRLGRATVICPPLQSRSVVMVKTLLGRADISQQGNYEFANERSASGGVNIQAVALAGDMAFTPVGGRASKPIMIPAENQLLVTAPTTDSRRPVMELTKLSTNDIDARLQSLGIAPAATPQFLIKKELPTTPTVAPAPDTSAPQSTGLTQAQKVENAVNQLVERQQSLNPSPTGG